MRWMQWTFVRNAINALKFCKKCVDCGERAEIKYFTAFHRFSYKNSPQKSPHFLQKFAASIFLANVRNAVKAVNVMEKKYFTAFHFISYNNSLQNSPHFLENLTVLFFTTFSESDLKSQKLQK